MKNAILIPLVFLLALGGYRHAEASDKPNIILIFADDLGWPAISKYGNKQVDTKNIDQLAKQGMTFRDAYVTPQCTPTRAAMLTGQHTARNKMWHVIGYYGFPYARLSEPVYKVNLPRDTVTFPKLLQKAGYKTACFGKWHLTTNDRDGYYLQLFKEGAQDFGFDEVDPRDVKGRSHKTGDKKVNQLTDLAIDFMKKHRERPFFIYLSHHTVHGPVLAPKELVEKYRGKGYPDEGNFNATYLAALEHLDDSVGRLTKALDDLDLAKKTVVIFHSDNGGVDVRWKNETTGREFSNAPLRYGKGTPYEGGIRVPLIVRWPGQAKADSVCQEPVHVIDLFPTMLDWAGVEKPDGLVLDGMSLVPVLNGKGTLDRDAIYFHMPLYDFLWGATPCGVVRSGDWKLIEFFGDYVDREDNYKYVVGRRVELYNLKSDIGEKKNLAELEPAKRDELLKKLSDWRKKVRAPMPTLNKQFDAKRVFEVSRKRPGK